jgi:hypothetical protein
MNKQQMIAFLVSHSRYWTMSSHNLAHSYARNVKLRNLSFPSEAVRNTAYDLLNVEGSFDESGVNDTLREFGETHDFEWQMGFNGRSGGYIVLYQGGCEFKDYADFSNSAAYGGRAYSDRLRRWVTKADLKKMGLLGKQYRKVNTSTQGVDMDEREERFASWLVPQLRERVKLVKEFDAAVDLAVKRFIEYAAAHKVEDKTISVPKTIRVAVPV